MRLRFPRRRSGIAALLRAITLEGSEVPEGGTVWLLYNLKKGVAGCGSTTFSLPSCSVASRPPSFPQVPQVPQAQGAGRALVIGGFLL